jgi:hypothetical protein
MGPSASLTGLHCWEECESGRIGTIGNRVLGNQPWVQIPPPPLVPSVVHLDRRDVPAPRRLRHVDLVDPVGGGRAARGAVGTHDR